MIRLRGHHLICLHFFSGEGFQPGFIKNLKEIRKRAESGEEVSPCPGPDDICACCPHLKAEACIYRKDADDEIRSMDRAAHELMHTKSGGAITWQDLKKKIPEIFSLWSAQYCSGCDWKGVCEKDRWFSRLTEGISG